MLPPAQLDPHCNRHGQKLIYRTIAIDACYQSLGRCMWYVAYIISVIFVHIYTVLLLPHKCWSVSFATVCV